MLQKVDQDRLDKVLSVIEAAKIRFPVAQLSKDLGVDKSNVSSYLSGKKPMSENFYTTIINKYKNLLEEIEAVHSTPTYQDQLREKKLNRQSRNSIPFFDAEATAGITETEMSPIHAPSGTIDIGDLLHDSQAAIRIYGNSMLPNYPPGCVVGLAKVSEKFIQPGEVYVVETDGQRILKRLFYKDDDPESEYFTLYSDNIMKYEGGARNGKLAYPPTNIHRDQLHNLFAVTGVIKRNTNSIIMHRNNKPK